MDDTPPATTDLERARVYYRTALACEAQGKYDEADRHLLKARIYAPKDKVIEQEQKVVVKIIGEQGEKPELELGDGIVRAWLGR
ncbi:MAG: hypothetical protein Q9218_008035 [Villophora microphyllina]